MWIYKSVAEGAGTEIGHDIALSYLLYFLLPAAAVFGVFFIDASTVQFIAFIMGRTPFPKWYCVFNLLIGKAVFNSVRQFGNTALINGIATSNMSLSAIVMFTALLIGWKKYVSEERESCASAFSQRSQAAGRRRLQDPLHQSELSKLEEPEQMPDRQKDGCDHHSRKPWISILAIK